MKNKLSVFAAIVLAVCLGITLHQENIVGSVLEFILMSLNLYAAGFFEDSSCK